MQRRLSRPGRILAVDDGTVLVGVASPCGSCGAGACGARADAPVPLRWQGRFSGRMGDTVRVSVSAAGLLLCVVVLFAPATLVLVIAAAAHEAALLAAPGLVTVAAAALLLVLWLGGRAGGRLAERLLRLSVALEPTMKIMNRTVEREDADGESSRGAALRPPR